MIFRRRLPRGSA